MTLTPGSARPSRAARASIVVGTIAAILGVIALGCLLIPTLGMSALDVVVLAAYAAVPLGIAGLILALVGVRADRARALVGLALGIVGIALPLLANLTVFGHLLPIGF